MAEMLVLGDSIAWGQGLAENEKASTLLAGVWRANRGGTNVRVHRFAHSGADIWDDGQSGAVAALDPTPPSFARSFAIGEKAVLRTRPCGDAAARDASGEIPDEEPYLLRQILDARIELAGTRVDLVVVDAGINDTEVYNLVLPGKNMGAVIARGRSVESRMDFVLDRIGEAFPHAKVIVTGYYPVVSDRTHLGELLRFTSRVIRAAVEEGVRAATDVAHMFSGAPKPEARAPAMLDLAGRCRGWTDALHLALARSVETFQKAGRRAVFVDPDFQPDHAVFAPGSLLWPFENGMPTDPLAGARSKWCVEHGIVGFDKLVIEVASMGHPNRRGAARYAEKMVLAAKALGIVD